MRKKTLLGKAIAALATAALVVCAPTASAKVYLSEDFDYPAGELYQQGDWVTCYQNYRNQKLMVADGNLLYSGYSDGKGRKAQLGWSTNGNDERCYKAFAGAGEGISTGTVYYSALINISQIGTPSQASMNPFITFIKASSANDAITDSSMAQNFAGGVTAYSSDAYSYYLGISKEPKTTVNFQSSWASTRMSYNKTYLIVVKYEFVDGTYNDVVSLFINPTDFTTEPTPTISMTSGNDASFGLLGMALIQGRTSSRNSPKGEIDAVRVADSWEGLFSNEHNADDEPSINPGEAPSFAATFVGESVAGILNVKAKNITSDISVSVTGPFSAPKTISADEAMEANGVNIAVNFEPVSAGENQTGSITFTSGEATATVPLTGTAYAITEFRNANQLANYDDYTEMRYTGKAVITLIDTKTKRAYAQDNFGGICFDFEYGDIKSVSVGDEITNVIGMKSTELGAPLLAVYARNPVINAQGKTKEPLELTATEFNASPSTYIWRLITIKDVTFTPVAGQKFEVGTTVRGTVNNGAVQVAVMPVTGTSLIGEAVPEKASVTGVSRSASIISLSPRGITDIAGEGTTAPVFEVTPQTLFTDECAPMGRATNVMSFTVNYANLASAVPVTITGSNASMFTASTSSIPAGTGEMTVTVAYNPTVIGKHTGRINFEVTPTELSTGANFTFYAYDPNNLPSISVEPETIPAFAATTGGTHEQSIKLNARNFPDNGSIKVMGDANGAFRINNTILSKYGEMTLKITFAPQSEGEYTERIELKGMMLDPVYITLTGSTTSGGVADEKEGDELPLSTLNPRKLLNETFTTTSANNTPVKIDGWKNVATEGLRAFWNMRLDGNGTAKATGYDSRIAPGEGTPSQMMLVTPALDYVNSDSKLLAFSIMGQNLTADMTDRLEVCYIDMDGSEMYVEPIALDIPAIADYNNEWRDYTIDLSGNDAIADVFFIGFRFTTTRGRDNSAVYYIDNVSWGRTDLPFIRPDQTVVEMDATTGKPASTTISVTAENLSDDIEVTFGGANASCFSVDTPLLTSLGGNLTVTFVSNKQGVHTGEIYLSSEGAPTSVIMFTVHNIGESGIESIEASEATGPARFFNLQGIEINREQLVPGIYIMHTADKTVKVAVK